MISEDKIMVKLAIDMMGGDNAPDIESSRTKGC